MKLEDYRCDDCSNIWEVFKRGTDPEPCPRCGSENTHRKFPTPMVAGETPYRTLDKHGIPGKKIVSGPHYRSK
jgi:putative FmdB family regulatory protein